MSLICAITSPPQAGIEAPYTCHQGKNPALTINGAKTHASARPAGVNRIVAVDVMSGDRGCAPAIEGMRKVVQADKKLGLVAVGDARVLERSFNGCDRITVEDAPEIVTMDEKPFRAVRRRRTSMFCAVKMVRDGRADAALSAGNTGALMMIARMLLKMRKDYCRPAIGSFVPCKECTDSFFILDLGANLDRSADMLVDFARMGAEQVADSGKTANPRVALLNIGTEMIKGGSEILEADSRLRDSDLNYVGFTESNLLYQGVTDVAVCDGFSGNVFLKTMEGLSTMIKGILSQAFTSGIYGRTAGLMSLPVLRSLQHTIDHRHYNGAALLGLQGLVVKSHGNADAVGFAAAVRLAAGRSTRMN